MEGARREFGWCEVAVCGLVDCLDEEPRLEVGEPFLGGM